LQRAAHAGKRPDLKDKVLVPKVLIQAHSSTLDLVFYDADAFPSEYRGDAFATLHGSWNREDRTGYKVIRARMKDGKPTGVYEDFMTGFVLDKDTVWGRPSGIAVARTVRYWSAKTLTARSSGLRQAIDKRPVSRAAQRRTPASQAAPWIVIALKQTVHCKPKCQISLFFQHSIWIPVALA